MALKITTSRVYNKQYANKGHIFLIVKFKLNDKEYVECKQVPLGMESMHGRIALQLFTKMQQKHNLYPDPDVIKRTRFERIVYKINRLWKKLLKSILPKWIESPTKVKAN